MIKRIFDFVCAFVALLLLFPLIFLIAISVRVNLSAPVLFRQERPGLNGQIFNMVKFRSMKDSVDSSGNPLPDEDRITPFGQLLRSLSLDELPELWNVITGDMSLVGPRPLLKEYLPLYSADQARRHAVRPGITGWAQINGRNALTWDEKFKLDVWYVDNQSLWLDLKILVFTIKKVFVRENITSSGHVSAEAFKGNEK